MPLDCTTLWRKYYYPLFYETADLREIKYISKSSLHNKQQRNDLNSNVFNFKPMQLAILFYREQINEKREKFCTNWVSSSGKSHMVVEQIPRKLWLILGTFFNLVYSNNKPFIVRGLDLWYQISGVGWCITYLLVSIPNNSLKQETCIISHSFWE